jgi:hypothetical protein
VVLISGGLTLQPTLDARRISCFRIQGVSLNGALRPEPSPKTYWRDPVLNGACKELSDLAGQSHVLKPLTERLAGRRINQDFPFASFVRRRTQMISLLERPAGMQK